MTWCLYGTWKIGFKSSVENIPAKTSFCAYIIQSFRRISSQDRFTLKMATKIISETLDNFLHLMRLIPESRSMWMAMGEDYVQWRDSVLTGLPNSFNVYLITLCVAVGSVLRSLKHRVSETALIVFLVAKFFRL